MARELGAERDDQRIVRKVAGGGPDDPVLEVDLLPQNDETQPLFVLAGNRFARSNPKFMALKVFHERIFAAYRAREWDKARALIAQARTLSGANPVLYDLYLHRIAHLADHDDVRIRPQKRPHCSGKGESDFGMHLHLPQSFLGDLDWILRRPYFPLVGIDMPQDRMQCCGFP